MHTTRTYTCFAILCLSAVISAEPPVSSNRDKPIVSQRLLSRVADIIANGGDGSSRGSDGVQENEGPSIVDQELLNRIARIISQNDGQLSWSQKGHAGGDELDSPTNNNEISYGVPPVEAPAGAKELAGGTLELSPPEPVPRIASFDFTDDDESSFPPQRDSYADNGNLYRGSDKLQLGEPETALRIASFDIEGEQPPLPYTPPQGRAQGGYSTLRRS